MKKAVLIIDMPDSCSKCPLFGDYYADMCCRGMNNRGINYPYPEDFRQDWCPLKIANVVDTSSNPLIKPLIMDDLTT